MKRTILTGLIAAMAGLAIGYKVPKNKNAGYVMISGRITTRTSGKYFEAVNDVVVKGCGAKTLSVDFETDVREGYDDRFLCFQNFK